MTTSTELQTTVADQARQATEKSVDVFKQGAKTLSDTTDAFAGLPVIDLAEPVHRYFELLSLSVDVNRELTLRWVQTLKSLSGVVREQAESFGNVVRQQVDSVSDLVSEQAAKADELAHQQAEQAEQAEKELVRKAKAAEREQAKKAHEQAREPYAGLTKAELSEQLTERDLPKTGTVDELIERLVEADSK